jgi:ABC-2 type transport system permease protein
VNPLGALVVWRWELSRLAGQLRVRVVAGVALLGPWLLVAGLAAQGQVPRDTLFGIWVHASGWAVPLVVLTFTSTWLFPLLVATIASGVFAGDDEAGVWPVLLTRGRTRGDLFAGKVLAALTAAAVVVLVLAGSSILAGLALSGNHPLVGLSGNLLPAGRAATLTLASWASVLPPVLALTSLALLFSALTRNSVAAVLLPVAVGIRLQVDSFITGGDPLRHLLVTTPLAAWHGLLAQPGFLHPLLRGYEVSLAWFVVTLGLAAAVFRRREFLGA